MARFSASVLDFFRLLHRKSWTRDARTARKAVKRVSAEWLKAAVASKWYLCSRLRFFTAQNLNLLGGSVEKRKKICIAPIRPCREIKSCQQFFLATVSFLFSSYSFVRRSNCNAVAIVACNPKRFLFARKNKPAFLVVNLLS